MLVLRLAQARVGVALAPRTLRCDSLVALALQLGGRGHGHLLKRHELLAAARGHAQRVHRREQGLGILLAVALAERNLRLELRRLPPALGDLVAQYLC